ncbi:MAG: hypothetical protein LBK41_08085 [Clostridiales bacterium]|jgi:hypothetical protein|nr:hypothetical protein [Clostridiales bacterium]
MQTAVIISEKELIRKLEELKSEIQGTPFLHRGHVVFLNLDSFYNYMSDMSDGGVRAKNLMDDIGPYIPMSVSESHMEMFVNAALGGGEDILHNIERYFEKISKINFINAVYTARADAAWRELVRVCCAMRDLKEEELFE